MNQAQLSYNDADQPTTTQTSTNPTGQGFTTTLAYDSTGALSELSNNTSKTPDLATLVYNARAQLDTINFQTSSGGALAAEQFSYDANLRPTGATATWQGGSGNSGTLFSQGGSYDNAGNVTNLSTTQAAVPGQSGSGGSETQNFCYDEQNRLVWAGNSGTQPGAGNGTCGSGSLASGLTGANYSNSYVYTHLGQLWQGPLPGGSTQEQYLYCASNTHQLIGLYPTTSGATCSNYSTKTADYSIGRYDGFGNVASRTAYSTTGTLTYDLLDHLTQWSAGSTNQEQYLYDASGERMLRRFTNNNGTTILTYPFGIEEHQYSGTGSNQWNVYYYFLAGKLLGSLDGNGTQFYLTDAQSSIVSAFTNAQGGASMKSNQLFGPYGNVRYYAGNLNTARGFLGQYNDGSGLDYFNARYYDPVAGMFMSADTVQGNMQAMNPYAYVNGNPETQSDPSGRMFITEGGGGGLSVSPPPSPPPPSSCSGPFCFMQTLWHGAQQLGSGVVHVVAKVADFVTGASSMINDLRTVFSSKAGFWDKAGAMGDFLLKAGMDLTMLTGIGEAARGVDLLAKGGVDLGEHLVCKFWNSISGICTSMRAGSDVPFA